VAWSVDDLTPVGCSLSVASAVCVGSSLRLSISPRGTQIKKIGSGIIFTCELVADNSTSSAAIQQLPLAADMRWVGPDLEYVSSAKGSRYVYDYVSYT